MMIPIRMNDNKLWMVLNQGWIESVDDDVAYVMVYQNPILG
jgi:hypothetical protein